METFLGYLVGLVVGLILGLLGGGGSLLVVAIVYLLQKEPIGLATAYITLLVGISALFGFIPRVREKQIDWSTLLWLGIPVSAGMLLVRLWLIAIVPDELFVLGDITITKKMFVLLLVATLMFLSFTTMVGLIGKNIQSKAEWKHTHPARYYSMLVFFGLLIGILPGFSGAGGGVLIVPLLVIFFGLEMKVVIGTSLGVIAMKSFVGFFGGDWPRLSADASVQIDWVFLIGFAAVMIVGVFGGTALSKRFDNQRLKQIFAWFLCGLSVYIVVNELFLR